MNYKSVFSILLLLFIVNTTAFALQDMPKEVKKEKKIVKFFKNLFKHNDSAKQARKFIHQHHKILKDKKAHVFSSVDVKKSNLKKFFTPKDFKLNYEVFGWYPYWEKDYYKNINFSLLSTVAYFSYELNPKTGAPITTHDWSTTPLIDSIKAKNKKVLLTVSNFGDKNNRIFLKNANAVETLIDNLVKLVNKRQANGVCIDFEGVEKRDKSHYTSFLLSLSNRLKSANKDYQIYVTVPSVNWSESIDFGSVNKAVDCFVIMGYDYYGKGSKVAGPVSPLKSEKFWEPYNLTTSVDYYKSHLPSNKIILALPTYGTLWETKNLDVKSKVKKYIGSRTYSYIKTNIEKNESIYIDDISKSAYSVYRVKGDKTTYRQCWFENETSFKFKTQLIKQQKLKGLGIWALGYDKGYDGFWQLISDEFGQSPSMNLPGDGNGSGSTSQNNSNGSNQSNSTDNGSVNGTADSNSNGSGNNSTSNGGNNGSSSSSTSPSVVTKIVDNLGLTDPNSKINKVEKKLVHITNYKTILLYIMCFVLFFACVGFVIAMLSPNTRNNFFNNKALRNYYIAFMLILAIIIFRMQNIISDGTVFLIVGFLLGISAYYLADKMIERKEKDLP
ncbi:glycosyl hydrolase family 18 protein [Tenacibaculum sp. M341]|uniref:glycosyl hydrolase family 18 protein n=1 Tax=Tenacibaculum sp. M341 TaxID=2530339 RepID=UPI001049A0E1|nr:glycosyl hydrolase family 18 protein [Tenacibaculum sp. M341]TCI93174.1 hypothetical protein EYW44_06030 [Tenacibaculum sp. M341]